MIVDTHVHVVSADRTRYPVLPRPPDWPVTEADGLVRDMDALGVDRAVLVQTFFTYGADNSYMVASHRRYPDRFQTVCVIDQTRADAADTLSTLFERDGVRGLRLMPKGHPEGVLTDPRTFPLWRRAAALGIPVTIAAEAEHLPAMPGLVERFPDVTICFEHMWALEISDLEACLRPILPLARFANVRLKLAPNNSVALRKAALPPESFFGRLAETFGIERMMWGSNYPAHSKLFGPLADRLRIMQEDFAFMTADDRARFFGGTAATLWNFE